MLLREHRGAVSADLRRFYGCNLSDVLAGRVAPLRDVVEWVAHLPPESAVHRAQCEDGEWRHTHALELQRAALFALERVAMFTGKTAGFKLEEPDLYLFPWEEEEGVIKGDSMDVDEADDWLGWTAEMKAHLQRTGLGED